MCGYFDFSASLLLCHGLQLWPSECFNAFMSKWFTFSQDLRLLRVTLFLPRKVADLVSWARVIIPVPGTFYDLFTKGEFCNMYGTDVFVWYWNSLMCCIYCFHPVFVDCAFSVALLFEGKRKNIWNLTEIHLLDLSAESRDIMCSLLCEIMLTEFLCRQ